MWTCHVCRKDLNVRRINLENVIIKEVSLEEALKVHPKIEEWDRPEAGTVPYCTQKMGNARNLILGAYRNDEIMGYLIAYEKNNSFYCWLTAVDKRYRKKGILTEMMNLFEKRAKELGYNKVTLKTVNNKREMLCYLIKNHWNISDVIKKDKITLNEILVEKDI